MFFNYDGIHSATLGLYVKNRPINLEQESRSSLVTTEGGQRVVYQNNLSEKNKLAMQSLDLYKDNDYALKSREFQLELQLLCLNKEDHIAHMKALAQLFVPGKICVLLLDYMPGYECRCTLNGPITDVLTLHNDSLVIDLVAPDPLLYPNDYVWPSGPDLELIEYYK